MCEPRILRVFVAGNPAPQGSKRYVGRGISIETCKRLPEWRADIRNALLTDLGEPRMTFGNAPVSLNVEAILPRPKSAGKTKRVPAAKRPDWDKLSRAIGDAITSAGVWLDDAQVVDGRLRKRIAAFGETPGCFIEIADCDYM